MKNLRDMYYLLRLIVREIFIFLRNILVNEFPRLLTSTIEIENLEKSKFRTASSIKHVAANFAAFSIICTFLGILVFLSAKLCKENEDEDNGLKNKRPETTADDFLEDPIYHLPRSLISKAIKYHHDRGDEYFSEEGKSSRRENRENHSNTSDDFPRKISSTSLIFRNQSSDCSQYSENNQNSWRNLQKVKKSQHWLIRKTRSGLVYGKYPI